MRLSAKDAVGGPANNQAVPSLHDNVGSKSGSCPRTRHYSEASSAEGTTCIGPERDVELGSRVSSRREDLFHAQSRASEASSGLDSHDGLCQMRRVMLMGIDV